MITIDVPAIQINQLEARIRRMEAFPRTLARENERMLSEIADEAKAEIDRHTPVASGKLLAGTQRLASGSGVQHTVRIQNRVPYGRYVEAGHGWIYPRKAKALRFTVGGRTVFAKRVRPVEGKHMFAKGREKAKAYAPIAARRALKRLTLALRGRDGA